jgi:hypothetical protein
MVLDYSQTVNHVTSLDAYPLPKFNTIFHKVAQFKVFSTVDLKSAYHQIPIIETGQPFTAFEASNRRYQFKRIPFGVTNGVAYLQRIIDSIISNENLQGTFAYLDDVTICGINQEDHDKNLQSFFETSNKYRITLNKEKCTFQRQQ